MLRIAVLKHHHESTPRRLVDAFTRARLDHFEVPVHQGDPLPTEGFEAVVVLGGSMGAYDTDRYPWLVAEKEYLRGLAERGVPVLGICLGSQLLADALSGKAYPAEVPEAGVLPIVHTEAGRKDPVLRHSGERVFLLHQDTFDPPPDAVLLARSELYPQAFRLGSVLGIQFHPETESEEAVRWAAGLESGHLRRAGVGLDDFTAQLRAAESDLELAAAELFDAWLAGL